MEQIYTIPINETFELCIDDPSCGCPLCRLHRQLEENELDRILGAALMEPDVRIETNRQGFCRTHYDMMFQRKNRLGMALTLESHLHELRDQISDTLLSSGGKRAVKRIGELEQNCYVCNRISRHWNNMMETVVLLWDRDENFPEKLKKQPYFCLPHYKALLEYAQRRLGKKLSAFVKDCESVEKPYLDKLCEDISWFCKKFDYRYADEPWNDAKDAIERSIRFLRSDLHAKPGEFKPGDSGGLR